MAFKTAISPTFSVDVLIPVPGEAGRSLKVTFRHKRRSALREWIEASKEKDDVTALLEVIDGWDADVAFSESAFKDLIEDLPGAAMVLFRAYVEESSGAARKN